jgi:alcohol dehydrogenase class IV
VQTKLARLGDTIGSTNFIDMVRDINSRLNIPQSFRETGLAREEFAGGMAELAANSLKGSTRVNPVPVTAAEMEELLWAVYDGAWS